MILISKEKIYPFDLFFHIAARAALLQKIRTAVLWWGPPFLFLSFLWSGAVNAYPVPATA